MSCETREDFEGTRDTFLSESEANRNEFVKCVLDAIEPGSWNHEFIFQHGRLLFDVIREITPQIEADALKQAKINMKGEEDDYLYQNAV